VGDQEAVSIEAKLVQLAVQDGTLERFHRPETADHAVQLLEKVFVTEEEYILSAVKLWRSFQKISGPFVELFEGLTARRVERVVDVTDPHVTDLWQSLPDLSRR
jgi:hypothetical protein